MNFLIPVILIGIGLALIFYIRPKIQKDIMEVKYMKTKTISELRDMFNQMEQNGLGNEYREFIELKGSIVARDLVKAPYSNKTVAYCESKLLQVTEAKEEYRDSNNCLKTRTIRNENTIANEKSSDVVYMKDNSSDEEVVLELNATGCKLEIPETFNRFENRNNLQNYSYFNSFSFDRFNIDTIGFKMVESTIDQNQNLYVIGEAFKVGDKIHIGKPQDDKKPFIITTKSEEDLINSSNRKGLFSLIGGIALIVIAIIFLIK